MVVAWRNRVSCERKGQPLAVDPVAVDAKIVGISLAAKAAGRVDELKLAADCERQRAGRERERGGGREGGEEKKSVSLVDQKQAC